MVHTKKHTMKYGFGIAAALIVYLLIMTVIGQVHNYNFRFLNFAIIGFGIYRSVKTFKDKHPDWFGYLRGLGIGFITALIAAATFTLFAAVILFTNPDFVEEARSLELQGDHLNTFTISMIVFMESFTSGLLFTYASMQWLKSPKLQSS